MVEPVKSPNTGQAWSRDPDETGRARTAGSTVSDDQPNVIGFSKPETGPGRRTIRPVPGIKSGTNAACLAALSVRASTAEKILAMEAQMRQLSGRKALCYFAANEFIGLIPCEQILIHENGGKRPAGRITTITALAAPDPNAPVLCWLQEEIAAHCNLVSSRNCKKRNVADETENPERVFQYRLSFEKAPGKTYSLPCALTVLLAGKNGHPQGAITFLSRRTLEGEHLALASRLCETYAHAERQFLPRSTGFISRHFKPLFLAGLLICAVAMIIPVPLTVLAPVTIQPFQPEVVSAPLTGVIRDVHVSPNTTVSRGELLFSYDRTQWQNQLDLAEKSIAIAQARFKRANQDALNAGEGRRELAIAKAELALALAERNAAARRLSMVEVRAESEGVVIFESREKWKGRPVSTGERVMRVADPAAIRFGIDLAVEDSIILSDDAPVKVFLDADPLKPIDARLTSTSYVAELSERDQLIFSLQARALEETGTRLRIGLKGTAQLYGDDVPLWFFLFRKPLSFLRQYFGL